MCDDSSRGSLLPRILLATEMAAVVLWFVARGRLQPVEWADTGFYEAYTGPWPTVDLLRGTRTLGFPLVLKLSRSVTGDYSSVPWLSIAAYLAAVWLLDVAWRRLGASRWVAWTASTGLVASLVRNYLVSDVLSDSLAQSASMFAVAFLVLVVCEPTVRRHWLGLVAAVTMSYHLRPAYQFLIALIPLLGFMVASIRGRTSVGRRLQVCAELALASAGPCLAYCLLRLALVGRFGLVSFGGITASGVAVELVDRPSFQVAARAINPTFARELETRLQNRPEGLLERKAFIDYAEWKRDIYMMKKFEYNLLDVSYPAGAAVFGADMEATDAQLGRFAKGVLWEQRWLYLRHVATTFVWGLQVFLEVNRPWLILALAWVAALLLRFTLIAHPSHFESPGDQIMLHALTAVAVLFSLAKLLTVSLVTVMHPRYVLPMTTFLAPLFGVLLHREASALAAVVRMSKEAFAPDE